MNISRRSFLKLSIAGFAVIAAPSIFASIKKENGTQVLYRTNNLKKGRYSLSAYIKKRGATEWSRHHKSIEVEGDDELLEIVYDMNKGDSICGLQLEKTKVDVERGVTTNLLCESYIDGELVLTKSGGIAGMDMYTATSIPGGG